MWDTLTMLVHENGRQAVEILLAAVLFYYILISVRGTKTAGLVQGLIVLAIIYVAATYLRLVVISMILGKLLFFVPIALIIIFVPEIRRFLERAGRTSRLFAVFFPLPDAGLPDAQETATFASIVEAAQELAQRHHGAIIAAERTPIDTDQIVTGTWLDAAVTEIMLLSVFEPHGPLHDGAAIIRGDRMLYAGCFFPLSVREDIDTDLGTRHRAALGITEVSNCIVIVVSEERGALSIAYGGRLARDLTERQFREQLRALYFPNPNFSTALSPSGV
jgi:diadenylate cyclase